LRRLSDDLHDWADTAAALATMAVLVSVDTGPLHLAAALDVPVWSLLTAEYWSFIYRDGIFYPSMRVFRKKMSEPWKPLMEEVAAALGVLARKHADDALAYEVA
jgi:ADP-heptose:LPS heptosyltransferase